ncbi:hypothetical protein JCGZ_21841 [Jatropha curcas]|uniref:Uncharacterized protein n=1 Tax=Jatropha curcas TaxID=180498 RepID=A0A067JMX6_JATCU|nr:hypothetical protein JCGZ_21841 [Jatropha curcas]
MGSRETRVGLRVGSEIIYVWDSNRSGCLSPRNTIEFGALYEGDKGETSTADGIEDCGPGINVFDVILLQVKSRALDHDVGWGHPM